MADKEPRSNAVMLDDKTISYDKTLWSVDDGMWTVYRTTKEAVAKVPSAYHAQEVIIALALKDKQK